MQRVGRLRAAARAWSAALVPHTGADGHRSLSEVSGALVKCRFADTAALHEPGIP